MFGPLLKKMRQAEEASKASIFYEEPDLIFAAQKLTEDYLEGQKNGESFREASSKYGDGVSEYYNMQNYHVVGVVVPKPILSPCREALPGCRVNGVVLPKSMLCYRVLGGNRVGGAFWQDTGFLFKWDKALDQQGDKYRGLRIVFTYEVCN